MTFADVLAGLQVSGGRTCFDASSCSWRLPRASPLRVLPSEPRLRFGSGSTMELLAGTGGGGAHMHGCPRQDWAAFTGTLKLRLYAKKVVELKAAIQADRSGRQV